MARKKLDYNYNQIERNHMRALKIMKVMLIVLIILNLTIPVASVGLPSVFNIFQWFIILFHFLSYLHGTGVLKGQKVEFVKVLALRLGEMVWFFLPFFSGSIYWTGWLVLLGFDFIYFLYLLNDKGKYEYL